MISWPFMQSIRKSLSSKLMIFERFRILRALRTFLYLSNQFFIFVIVATSYRFIASGFVLILCRLICFHHFLNHRLDEASQSWAFFKLTIALYIIFIVDEILYVNNDLIKALIATSSCKDKILFCSSCFCVVSRRINEVNVLILTSKSLIIIAWLSDGFFIKKSLALIKLNWSMVSWRGDEGVIKGLFDVRFEGEKTVIISTNAR